MQDRLLVLGLLKLQEMHGYQLSDLIDKRLNYLTDLKKPTLYHLLGRMEVEGLVIKSASRKGNRPERFTYQLTDAGEARFHELLQANLEDAPNAYFADDIGLLFLSEIPAGAARAYLEIKQKHVAERVHGLEFALALHTPGTPAYYTLHHHLVHLQTEHVWLDDLLRSLKKRAVQQDILACLAAEPVLPSKSHGADKKPKTKIQSRRKS